jgi:hypothetical protein
LDEIYSQLVSVTIILPSHIKMIENSMARWKRDAEAWYRQDSETLDGLLQTVEENVVGCVFLKSSGIALTAYSI